MEQEPIQANPSLTLPDTIRLQVDVLTSPVTPEDLVGKRVYFYRGFVKQTGVVQSFSLSSGCLSFKILPDEEIDLSFDSTSRKEAVIVGEGNLEGANRFNISTQQ